MFNIYKVLNTRQSLALPRSHVPLLDAVALGGLRVRGRGAARERQRLQAARAAARRARAAALVARVRLDITQLFILSKFP